jgi:hypothetical protein
MLLVLIMIFCGVVPEPIPAGGGVVGSDQAETVIL